MLNKERKCGNSSLSGKNNGKWKRKDKDAFGRREKLVKREEMERVM